MHIREKTLIIIVAIFAILILIEFVFSNSIVMGSFYSLEENDSQQKIRQAEGALQRELQSMVGLLDRAAKDDTYAFMAHPQASYIEQNMRDDTFVSQNLSLLLMVDGSGDITYGKAFDLKKPTAIPIPDSMRANFYAGSPLMLNSSNQSLGGVVVLPEGPLLVVAKPILDSQKKGPARGTMILGRYIDAGWITALSRTTQLDLGIYRLDDPGLSADLQKALNVSASKGTNFTVLRLGEDLIGGYYIIDDVFGKPALVLRVEESRPFYTKGKETIAYIILWTLIVGVIVAAIAMLLMSKIVLSRLLALDASVKKITSSDDLSARVEVVGDDELSDLSQAINSMLASLDLSRQRLFVSENHYHAVVEDQTELICRFRMDGSITFANEAYLRYFSMDSQLWPGQNFLHLLPPGARGDVEALLPSLTASKPAGVLECRFYRNDEVQWLQWNIRAIYDRDGGACEFQAVGRDISELKRNEEQIKASLKEKDALLKEIHHRVKNNLQIISSILSLQEAQVSDQASRDVLADSRNRIKSMALIHERLYRSGDLSSIDFTEYLRSLVSHLANSYGADGRIGTRTAIEPLSLNIDIAIPLGLIVNELVTNSFKHAFPGETTGEIYVELRKERERRYLLVVGDNGKGLPPDFDIDSTPSLGLQLVHALIQQANGQITVERGKGTVFKIEFST